MNRAMTQFCQMKPQKFDYENQLIEDMGHSLSFLVMGVLEARFAEFDCNLTRLQNLFNFVQIEKQKWLENDTTGDLIDEAKTKRKHVYEASKQLSFSKLLFITGNKKIKTRNPNMKAYLQAGYVIIGVWMDTVLQEHYRFNLEKRKLFFSLLNDWIDSYQKGLVSNDGIREQYIEDLNYDLVKGEKVETNNI